MSPSFSPYLLRFHSISLHSSLILVVSTASPLMRHRCSSMCRNALSSDLDTVERWPNLPLVWQRVTQPKPHHTTLLPSFKQPCALAQPRQSFLPASSGELEMTSNRKLRVGPSQRKSTNSRSRAWAHLYKLPHVVGGPIS